MFASKKYWGHCREDHLPGMVDDQLEIVRQVYTSEKSVESPVEFPRISVKWNDESNRNVLIELARKMGDAPVTPVYVVSNETISIDSIRRVNEFTRGTESFIGIAGGGTIPLRLISEIQNASGLLGTVRIVDFDLKALLHFEALVASYNQHPHLPVYYMKGVKDYECFQQMSYLDGAGYRTIRIKDGEGWDRSVLEIKKWKHLPNTEIVLVCRNILKEVREENSETPKKTCLYLSNVVSSPYEPYSFTPYLSRAESLELMHTIEENPSFADGSMILGYISSDVTQMYFLRKENGRISLKDLKRIT